MEEQDKKIRKINAILLNDPYWDMVNKGYYRRDSYYINALGEMCILINGKWELATGFIK